MSGHTPGPWSLKEHSSKEYGKPDLCSHAVMGANELQIATVVSDCIDDFEANARLIAAAPELLAALDGLLSVYAEPDRAMCCDGRECGCMGTSVYKEAEHYARAAIAKATQL